MMESWSDKSEADILGDINAMLDAVWQDDSWNPNTLILSERVWLRIVRIQMTKRQWRRYRGRIKQQHKVWRCIKHLEDE